MLKSLTNSGRESSRPRGLSTTLKHIHNTQTYVQSPAFHGL
jgi:hypothetical protein